MTVRMTTNYNPLRGMVNNLTADLDDLVELVVASGSVRLAFKGVVGGVSLGDYTPNIELEDRSKYWKTEDLIKQLDGWASSLESLSKTYAAQGGSSLSLASKYQQEAGVLRTLLRDFENGDEIWED